MFKNIMSHLMFDGHVLRFSHWFRKYRNLERYFLEILGCLFVSVED